MTATEPIDCPDCDGEGGGMYGASRGACETCDGRGTLPRGNVPS